MLSENNRVSLLHERIITLLEKPDTVVYAFDPKPGNESILYKSNLGYWLESLPLCLVKRPPEDWEESGTVRAYVKSSYTIEPGDVIPSTLVEKDLETYLENKGDQCSEFENHVREQLHEGKGLPNAETFIGNRWVFFDEWFDLPREEVSST